MFKRSLLLGIVSGIFAGIASLIYARVYKSALEADFSKVAGTVNIMATSLFGTVLAAIGFWAFTKWFKATGEIIFNLLFSIISFATLLGPISYKLPLDIEGPEFFLGAVIPMHFFPALAWFTLKPIFFRPAPVQ